MIRVTSIGGRIGPLCWSNTLPPLQKPDYIFVSRITRLEFWGRTYWCPPGESWSGLHYSCEVSFQ